MITNNAPPAFTGNELMIAVIAIGVLSLAFLILGLWLKFSGMRQHKKAKAKEEAELNIFQRGDADIVSDGGLSQPENKDKRR